MRMPLAVGWPLVVSAILLIPVRILSRAGALASDSGQRAPAHEVARLGNQAIVHAAGRGSPRINLGDGREVLTAYSGDAEAQRLLQQNLVQPLSMASGDFDEDGIPDLISAYAGTAEGVITLHRGNVDAIFPESPEAHQRKARGEFTGAPFLSPAAVFRLSETPDFIGAGDFNADGHVDVIFAARSGNSLHLLQGDGKGGLLSPVSIPLPGRVTAMVTGEINRRDGPSAVAVAVAAPDGAKVLVFESANGIASPETTALPAEANALAICHFDNGSASEVAVAAGNSLIVIRVGADGIADASPRISKRSFPFSIRSLAAGDFAGTHHADLALLSTDGDVRILSRPSKRLYARINEWPSELLASGRYPGATRLLAARVSSLPVDTVVAVDPDDRRLHLLTRGLAASTQEGTANIDASLDTEGEPVAVLPMRLNADALSDLVVLRSGRSAPSFIPTAPSMTFAVTNTNDTGLGSLRAAIDQANTLPGPDLINFDIGAGTPTINVGSVTGLPLPQITEAVTINGNTGGATRVELNGTAAGAGDGLLIVSTGVIVQNLVINRFSGAGITVQGDGNFVQGDFIGTNATGAAALPNASGGVLVRGANNTIGGTVAPARNVISGNNSFGVGLTSVQAISNKVQGNFIGTDASGALPVGNGNGVGFLGGASNNTLGGTLAGAGNTVAFNNGVGGVLIPGGTGNAVLSNSIFANAGLGIDISDDGGITPNDVCDGDPGANNLQNFPVLTAATSGGGNTNIVGTLNSTPGTTFRIEFFASPVCDPSTNGEGQTFIGFTTVSTIPPLCDVAINVNFPVAVPVGNVITATATDPSNNTSEFSRCVTVMAAPVCTITCPPAQMRSNDPNQCGAVVTYPPPTTAGPCGTVTCAPPSGSFFPKGTTVVTCNTVAGPSCVFNVIVNDTQPPTITCPANLTKSTDPNLCSAVVAYAAPTVNDNCPGAGAPTCNPLSGSTFPKGTTTVNCSATDSSANTAACSFTVAVNDTQPPAITCPANVTRSTDPNLCSAVVGYAAPTVSDNCPGVGAPTCNPPSGSTFQKGPTTVNCSATDSSANVAVCSFTVTVNDTQPPTITCPPNQTVPSNIPIVVNYPPPTAADNCPGVAAACIPPSGSIFPVGATTVTCTATDMSANTAGCMFTVTVANCTLTCPPNLLAFTSPTACGTAVTFSPTTTGACGTVTCAPPSGSFFNVGTATVTCAATAGPSCSFTVTVVDATPPAVSCPANIITSTSPGQPTAVVNYPPPSASDNCGSVSVQCAPPSGSGFPVGSTIVTCVAIDGALNSALCTFSITVFDLEPPVITCPAGFTVVTAVGQTSAVVTYPPPAVTDNRPGAAAVCAPASGSTLPLGVTTVTCTATDAGGLKASCSFLVKVGGPQAKLTIPTGKPSLEFATSPRRKPPKPKNNPCAFFTVENIGFAPLLLTLDSIARTGADVDSKRISDPNDTRYFTVSLVNADQTTTALSIGNVATIQPGQIQTFCVNFAALLPAPAGKTTGLAASDVLPDTLTSSLNFKQNAGANISIPISGRVSTELNFVNPTNPRQPAVVTFTRNGNEFTVSYSLFDSNLDISRAKYEFISGSGQVVAMFEVDLAGPIRSLNLIRSQSFSVEQRFTGANDNPEVTGVRLTVFDGETSIVNSTGATPPRDISVRLINRTRGVTVYLPGITLTPNFQ